MLAHSLIFSEDEEVREKRLWLSRPDFPKMPGPPDSALGTRRYFCKGGKPANAGKVD